MQGPTPPSPPTSHTTLAKSASPVCTSIGPWESGNNNHTDLGGGGERGKEFMAKMWLALSLGHNNTQ